MVMHTSPIILLVGGAGSGKDTIAGFMVKNHSAIAIAQADPMKRFAKRVFEFTDDQLWGPSSSRNAVDGRGIRKFWYDAEKSVLHEGPPFLATLGLPENFKHQLMDWFVNMYDGIKRGEQAFTPRYVLQTLGTEFGRTISRDVWSNYAIGVAKTLLGGGYKYDRTYGVTKAEGFAGPRTVVITDGRFRNELLNVRAMNGAVVRIDSPDTKDLQAGVKNHASETELKSIPSNFFTAFYKNDKSRGLAVCEEGVAVLMDLIENNCYAVGYDQETEDPTDPLPIIEQTTTLLA